MEFCPGKNTRVGSDSLLQGILLTQGSKLSLLHFGQIFFTIRDTRKVQNMLYPPQLFLDSLKIIIINIWKIMSNLEIANLKSNLSDVISNFL